MMYDELIKNLRKMENSEYCVIVSTEDFPAMQFVKQAADAIEELQLYESLYKDLTEKSQKVATELKQQLQKSEADNTNLTGWLAEEHAKRQWIPVTERLPENRGHYFAHVDGGEFEFVSYGTLAYFDGKIFRWGHFSNENWEEVTHWMPLPEPPRDGEEQAKEESEQIYKAYNSKAVKTGIKAFPEPPESEEA